MGKIYKRVWGYIFRLSHIGSSDGRSIRTKRRPNASLIRGGNGDGQCASGGKGRYGGISYFGYYIKSSLFIIDL